MVSAPSASIQFAWAAYVRGPFEVTVPTRPDASDVAPWLTVTVTVTLGLGLGLASAVAGCTPAALPGDFDLDRGAIEAAIEPEDRANWPGLDRAEGREINTTVGFFDGHPVRYWFLGFASRRTADSFWFCRHGDAACPLDEHRRVNWSHLVGNPVFSRIPGQEGFTPFWQMWVVDVPADYDADTIKTLATLDRFGREGRVAGRPLVHDFGTLLGDYVGPAETVLHCALVLEGTRLKHNGDTLWQDQTKKTQVVPLKQGWHEGYRINLYDFSVSDGVLPAAADSQSRANMPLANIFVHFRNCTANPRPKICDIPGYPSSTVWRPVTERGLGMDITNQGNLEGSNTVVPVVPCGRPDKTDLLYSPLWHPQRMFIRPEVNAAIKLVDTYGDPLTSDVKSTVTARAHLAAGDYLPFQPLREDETGNPIPGNEGAVLFDCPVQVVDGWTPTPCPQ